MRTIIKYFLLTAVLLAGMLSMLGLCLRKTNDEINNSPPKQ